jgi:glycosyltransferase involved in cell wall biosynthesis
VQPVAVVVPSYNYARFVGRAIRSAVEQTHPPVEVVVVDDGSTDGTDEVVRSFGPPVRLLSQANRGVSAARNAGVAATTAPLVAFLDADDAWLPRKLAAQAAMLEDDPGLGLVHCGVERVDEEGNLLSTQREGLAGSVAEDLLLLRDPGIPAGGSGALVPRLVLEAVGGFDERLSTSADWDLCLRIASAFRLGFVPEPLVRYTLHGANMHNNLAAMEHDVLVAYEKAFAAHPESLGALRHRALANLYATLSGSYLAAGETSAAVRYLGKAIRHEPRKAAYALQLPLRRVRRALLRPGGVRI